MKRDSQEARPVTNKDKEFKRVVKKLRAKMARAPNKLYKINDIDPFQFVSHNTNVATR